MRDAVKFLLDRMETNPDEFLQETTGGTLYKTGKHNWMQEINSYKKFFNEEEKELVQNKLSEINLGRMKERIAHKLLETTSLITEDDVATALAKSVRQTKDLVAQGLAVNVFMDEYGNLSEVDK